MNFTMTTSYIYKKKNTKIFPFSCSRRQKPQNVQKPRITGNFNGL